MSFTRADMLKAHEMVHSGIKAFSCETCGNSFARSSTLNAHKLTHIDVKPFKCTTCGKWSSGHLRTHEKDHDSGQEVKYPTCGESFSTSSKLRVHAKFHSGVKPFVSKTCGKSFV